MTRRFERLVLLRSDRAVQEYDLLESALRSAVARLGLHWEDVTRVLPRGSASTWKSTEAYALAFQDWDGGGLPYGYRETGVFMLVTGPEEYTEWHDDAKALHVTELSGGAPLSEVTDEAMKFVRWALLDE